MSLKVSIHRTGVGLQATGLAVIVWVVGGFLLACEAWAAWYFTRINDDV